MVKGDQWISIEPVIAEIEKNSLYPSVKLSSKITESNRPVKSRSLKRFNSNPGFYLGKGVASASSRKEGKIMRLLRLFQI